MIDARDKAPAAPPRPRKASAVVTGAQLDAGRTAFERTTAVLVWALSAAGTVAATHGGWPALLEGVRGGALLAALGVQLLATALQWFYRRRRASVGYLAGLAIDAVPSAAAYIPLAAPLLAPLLAPYVPEPLLVAGALIVVASVAAAWYPESRLVE